MTAVVATALQVQRVGASATIIRTACSCEGVLAIFCDAERVFVVPRCTHAKADAILWGGIHDWLILIISNATSCACLHETVTSVRVLTPRVGCGT